jgi:hypothetical protein
VTTSCTSTTGGKSSKYHRHSTVGSISVGSGAGGGPGSIVRFYCFPGAVRPDNDHSVAGYDGGPCGHFHGYVSAGRTLRLWIVMLRVSSKKTLAARTWSVISLNFSPFFSLVHFLFEFHHRSKLGLFLCSSHRTHRTLRAADKNALRLYLKSSRSELFSRMRCKKYSASSDVSLAALISGVF